MHPHMSIVIGYLCGMVFGFFVGLMVCELSSAGDSYYEQQNRRYPMDDTNIMRDLDNHRTYPNPDGSHQHVQPYKQPC